MNTVTEAVIIGLRELQLAGSIPHDIDLGTLHEQTALAAIGLDSLSRLTLLGQLEDRFDTLIAESELVAVRTIGDLARVTWSSVCAR